MENTTPYSPLAAENPLRQEIMALFADDTPAEYIRYLGWLLSDYCSLAAASPQGMDGGTVADFTYHITRIMHFIAAIREMLPQG